MEGREFSENLKEAKNIAVIADNSKGFDALCASVGLSELIKKFLKNEKGFYVSVYYLGKMPPSANSLKGKVKIKNKIGVRTLGISFPSSNLDKILYDHDEDAEVFKIDLVGYEGSVDENKNNVVFKNTVDTFDLIVGVGFENKEELDTKHEVIKKAEHKFVFNKNNLEGDTLSKGVLDLFYKENVVPTKIASFALLKGIELE